VRFLQHSNNCGNWLRGKRNGTASEGVNMSEVISSSLSKQKPHLNVLSRSTANSRGFWLEKTNCRLHWSFINPVFLCLTAPCIVWFPKLCETFKGSKLFCFNCMQLQKIRMHSAMMLVYFFSFVCDVNSVRECTQLQANCVAYISHGSRRIRVSHYRAIPACIFLDIFWFYKCFSLCFVF
jgi:hypothetical protein